MTKPWNWQEGTATYQDQDGDDNESKVQFAVVSEEQNGYEVPTLTGVTRVKPGDVLVQNPGDNSGRFDVVSEKDWKETGYAGGDSNSSGSDSNLDREDTGNTGRTDQSGGTNQTDRGARTGSGNRR